MSYEILVGLDLLNDQVYDEYRKAMKPILLDFKGYFVYDFKVSDVLISDTNNDINRIFIINFKSKSKMEGFFLNPEYLAIKEKYFTKSVGSTTILSSYQKDI